MLVVRDAGWQFGSSVVVAWTGYWQLLGEEGPGLILQAHTECTAASLLTERLPRLLYQQPACLTVWTEAMAMHRLLFVCLCVAVSQTVGYFLSLVMG